MSEQSTSEYIDFSLRKIADTKEQQMSKSRKEREQIREKKRTAETDTMR
jgi:hypothetical protein